VFGRGDTIDYISATDEWAKIDDDNKTAAYCFPNGNSSNKNEYGLLYTWPAAMGATSDNSAISSDLKPSGVQGACPDGWHIPSKDEWRELTSFVEMEGYSDNQGEALKAKTGWGTNKKGTDIYGFKALPAGNRWDDGRLIFGEDALWWTSLESNANHVYSINMYSNNGEIGSFTPGKSFGLSVRCLKD
jgi:uncharacterized protein (TIGR02145 family)